MGTDQQEAVAAPEVWLTADQQRHWRAYLAGAARLTETLNRQLEQDSGLSLSEYEILVRLSEAPDHTVRMSELAASLVHSRSRITHTVTRLERSGLVRRENCPGDGRGVNCRLTDAGYGLLAAAAPGHARAVRDALIDRLTDSQLNALGDAMSLVAPPDVPASPASS